MSEKPFRQLYVHIPGNFDERTMITRYGDSAICLLHPDGTTTDFTPDTAEAVAYNLLFDNLFPEDSPAESIYCDLDCMRPDCPDCAAEYGGDKYETWDAMERRIDKEGKQ